MVAQHGERDTPTYDLKSIQDCIDSDPNTCSIRKQALNDAARMKLGPVEIWTAVCELESKHFKKSMESKALPGTWQDVYELPEFYGHPIYLKLQMVVPGAPIVIAFKDAGSPA